MYKAGIIGERGSVLGFMALGFSVLEAEDTAAARATVDSDTTTEFRKFR